MGSMFFKTQLVDIFAYELPSFTPRKISNNTKINKPNTSMVYNFHNLLNQTRYYLFAVSCENFLTKKHLNHFSYLSSITELFSTAAWLEREVAELHGINFLGKKDLRNLMLQYGDTTAPFKKSNPSTGFREIFYDSVSDHIVQNYVTFQG
jgi:NADH:ubiquinone oxidoreductase subunit C